MKKTSKILSVIMVLALLATSMMMSTVSVHAEDQVILNWDFSTVEDDVVKDSSGKGNDGYINDGVTIEDGKAVFAEGNQGIELPDDIFEDAEKITIEMTISPSAFADYTALLCVGELNGEWVVIGLMADGSVRYAIATNGEDSSEAKGNSVSGQGGATAGVVGSDIVLSADEEYAVKYVITQEETEVYVDDELALTVPTPDKELVGYIGGPVVLGKATKWPDPSYRGTISSLKISVPATEEVPATEAPADPTGEATATPEATEEATATPEATEEATATPKATTAKPSATKAPTASSSATTTPAPADGEFPIWIVIVIAAVVVVAVVVVVIIAKKKKA